MSEAGKICIVENCHKVTTELDWKINDIFPPFNETPMYNRICKNSPTFSILDTHWSLCLQYEIPVRIGYIRLICMEEGTDVHLTECSFDIINVNGAMVDMPAIPKRMESFPDGCIIINLSEIQKRKSELAPLNVLTITCSFKFYYEYNHFDKSSLMGEPKHKKLKNDSFFIEDYKKMFQEGKNHDLILKIRDEEFPVHRDILMARSEVFESMLNHDMKEKNSGVIEVSDCDPQVMEQFLQYLYCGKVESLGESNVFGLYYAADKYNRKDLKEECRDFLKKSLSPTNVCAVLQLAVNHSDSDIQNRATEYVVNNMEDILRTSEWDAFQRDNQTIANELIIKFIQKSKNVKD